VNKKLALLATPALILAASAATANHGWGVMPYVGADAEWRHMNFQNGFGDNLFRHDYPQGNLYAGLKFNDYVAVEAGYEATARKTRAVTLGAGSLSGGAVLPLNVQFHSTGQIKGPHANLVGFLPLCDQYRLELIGMVGVARLKANFVRTAVASNGTAISPSYTTFIKRKSVLRLGGGIQQMITECWGIRAMLKWENTKKLDRMGAIENSLASLRPKNSFIYSLGTFLTF